MKKLFTLIALLTMFMSAKAVLIIDGQVNFSDFEDGPSTLAAWGGGDRLSFQNGYLHYHGETATENAWDVQFFPIQGMTIDPGVTYTVEFKIKGSVAGPIFNMKVGGVDKYGLCNLAGGDQWETFTFEYTATSTDGSVLFQCGSYVGDWDMAYMKVYHEGKEEKPVEWIEMLYNGDAEKSWADLGFADVAYNDQENNYRVCAWGKTKGRNEDAVKAGTYNPFPADIEDDGTGNHVFVVHAAVADTPATDTEDASAWDNQFWIEAPRMLKAGEQFKISFRYKASQPVNTQTQFHYQNPSDYLFYQAIGDVKFTTEWQTFEQKVTIPDSGDKGWSIAFNLNPEVKEAVDFYFDDISWCEMKLEKGLFVSAANTVTAAVEYDFDNATQLVYDENAGDYVGGYTAIVGTAGKQDSWVNEVMISTVRGNDRAYKSNTIKVSGAVLVDDWSNYVEASNAKIKLPAAGVWEITINTEYGMIYFHQIEGEKIADPIVVTPNASEVVVNGQERSMTLDEAKNASLIVDPENPTQEEKDLYNGQPWDNQFFIVANRALETGEETIIEFDYVATKEAKASTQLHGEPGGYLHYAAIGDINFTTEMQHFSGTLTVPSQANGMKSIAFNMAEIKEACDYTITNVVWKLADETETLIDMEGTKNFYVVEGAGDTPHEFGTTTGINAVAPVAVRSGKYLDGGNLIIVRNGKAYNVAGVSVK